jgi:hypothetical protein
MESPAPLTASTCRPSRAGLSALQRHSGHRAPCEDGPPADPLGRDEPPDASSSPHSSRATGFGRRDDVTTTMRGGDSVDDPDMSLQSTAALATSPLHDGSSNGSLLEETSRSPAFCLLMRLSFRSRLAISRSLCCTLRAACCLSAAAWFRLKIASFGRGALAGTRCAHLSYENKERKTQPTLKVPEKTSITIKSPDQQKKLVGGDSDLPISLSPCGEASGAVVLTATNKTPSRSPALCGAGSQVVTGGSARSRSPSRGADRPSSRRDEAATSGAAQLLESASRTLSGFW